MILSPRWRKVVRDLWDNKSRTLLVVLSIAIGVFAFGSLFIAQYISTNDMQEQARQTNIANIAMSLSPFDSDLVNWARRQPEVTAADGRAIYGVRLVSPEKEYALTLYASDDWDAATVNMVNPETGQWPPQQGQILLERTSAKLLDIEVGDTVIVKMSNDKTYELIYAGTTHDLTVMPATMRPQLAGYVDLSILADLGLPKAYTSLELTVDPGVISGSTMRRSLRSGSGGGPIFSGGSPGLIALGDRLQEELERRGMRVNGMELRGSGEHWAADIVAGLGVILLSMGFFSLALSGFLVINTISSLLSQQRRQVGMMKVVGATAGQITSIYLVMVACFGILALLIAVPAGLGLAYYLLAFVVVENLNFDLLHFYLPWQILLLEVGVGLASPLFAALVPILGGTRLTAAQAISDFSSSGRTSFLDAIMARIRGLPSPVMLAIRNTFRKRMRLALTLATLTFAGMLFISIVNVRNSLLTEVDNILSMSDFDVQVIFNGSYDRLAVEKRAMQVPGVVYAEGWAITSAQRIRPGGAAGGNFTIYGLQPASTFTKPIITDGRWIEAGDRYAVVITTELLRDETDLRVGETIKLDLPAGRKDWEIVGVIKSSQPAAYALYDRVADLSGLPNQTSVLNVRTAERTGPFQITLAGMLRDHYDDWDIKVLRTSTSDEIISGLKNNFNVLIYILFGMAILVAAVGGLGLAGMMSLNVMERTREIGVIRAVGASDDAVRRIVLVEGMMVGLISWVGALPLAFPVSQVFDEALGNAVLGRVLPFTYDLRGVGIWLLFILVIAAGASLLPARRAARISVREALAYE